MPDTLKNDLVDTTFTDGEQPSASKLTRAVDQLATAVEKAGRAVGDLFTQQTYQSGSGPYDLDEIPNTGPNLARYVGSAGWLNPRRIGRQRKTISVVFVGNTDTTYEGYTHYRRRVFKLPFPPVVYRANGATGPDTDEGTDVWLNSGGTGYLYTYSFDEATYWSIDVPGGTYTDVVTAGPSQKIDGASRVDDLVDLDASLEYHVAPDGTITLYEGLDSNEGFKVTYTVDTPWDSYDGASLNVIPDFSQTTTLCTVTLSGSEYTIVLPTATYSRGRHGTYGATTLSNADWDHPHQPWHRWEEISPTDHPMSTYQCELPYHITGSLSGSVLSTDDVIPEGYIYLWDEDNGTIISGASFTYVNEYTIKSTGVTLEECTDRYRVIVPGTSLARTVYDLRESYVGHTHSGEFDPNDLTSDAGKVSHCHLLNLVDEGTDSVPGFMPSSIGPARHPHPQYLHRYGYQYMEGITTDGRNLSNAFLGTLLISATDYDLDVNENSNSIVFGGRNTGPFIRYVNTEDALSLERKSVYFGKTLDTTAAEYATPRIKMEVPSSGTGRYVGVSERTCSSSISTRLYASAATDMNVATQLIDDTESVEGLVDGAAATFTVGSEWDGAQWNKDTIVTSSRFDIRAGGFGIFKHKSSGSSPFDDDASDGWIDPRYGMFSVAFDSISEGAFVRIRDGLIQFLDTTEDNISGGSEKVVSNPNGSTYKKNILCAKNASKAWGLVEIEGGSPPELTVNVTESRLFNIDMAGITINPTLPWVVKIPFVEPFDSELDYVVNILVEVTNFSSSLAWADIITRHTDYFQFQLFTLDTTVIGGFLDLQMDVVDVRLNITVDGIYTG